MINITQLFQDHNVTYVSEGHKHSRPGWINVECPHCTGNAGYHLGFNLNDNYFVCWRCGSKPLLPTLSLLLNVSIIQVKKLLPAYSSYTDQKKTPKCTKPFKLPSNLIDQIPIKHRRYLESRNFDPDYIQKVFKTKYTKFSELDGINYSNRIIIPVFDDQLNIVTFNSRSIINHNTDSLRYLACPVSMEIVNIKKTLYGRPDKWGDIGVFVEGATDVWRLGVYASAVGGIEYSHAQVRLMAEFKRSFVVFDPEKKAQAKAEQLVSDLRFRGRECINVTGLPCDPGDLDQDDAKYLMNELLKPIY